MAGKSDKKGMERNSSRTAELPPLKFQTVVPNWKWALNSFCFNYTVRHANVFGISKNTQLEGSLVELWGIKTW